VRGRELRVADVLTGQVDVDLDAFEISTGVWVAEGADVHPEATLKGPLYVGDYAKVEAGAELREFTVPGSNVHVKSGAFPPRPVVPPKLFFLSPSETYQFNGAGTREEEDQRTATAVARCWSQCGVASPFLAPLGTSADHG